MFVWLINKIREMQMHYKNIQLLIILSYKVQLEELLMSFIDIYIFLKLNR